jgi:hypothetical protein
MTQQMSTNDEKPLDRDAARVVAKARWLLMIASLTTFLAVATVIAVIGYRVFRDEGRVRQAPLASSVLSSGTKVLSSAVGDGRVVLTVESEGAIELLSFDLNTLKPLGRVRLAP